MPAIVGYDYSWWVDYSWSYEVFDEESHSWVSENGFDGERFACHKKDIKKEAKKRIENEELCGVQYRNLKVHIALDSEWKKFGDKHYCPDCYELDDEDHYHTKDGKVWDAETEKEVI